MNSARFTTPPASACSLDIAGSFGKDRITKYDYDTESRTTKVTSGYGTTDEGIDTETTYTANGQVQTLSDGNGNITVYEYDRHDRLNRVDFPNSTFEQFGYDGNSNKTSWRKRDVKTLTYQYDVMNQLEKTTVPSEVAINYFYDGLGRPTEVNRGTTNKTVNAYDKWGFLASSATNGSAVTYINDLAGRVTTMTYPQGQKVLYGYDTTNAVTDVDAQQGATTQSIADYQFDNMGRVTNMLLGDGGSTTYQYDAIDNVLVQLRGFCVRWNALLAITSSNPPETYLWRTLETKV